MGKETVQHIPLNQLHASLDNVRQTEPPAQALKELKASIHGHGLLQNLVVRDMGDSQPDRYQVTSGRRRLRALRALAEEDVIAKTFPVPCRMVNGDASNLELSLAENEVRVQMHPADAFEAYQRLNREGQTTAIIAERFGVTERRVHQLLSLAACAPELIAAYRDKAMDLETLKAFTVTTDHERQRAVWARIKLGYHTPKPREIQAMLTEGKVPATAAPARLIGIETYEAAGGTVERDLFTEVDERGIYFTNADILDRLVDEHLQAEARTLLEHWKWAQVELNVDYNRLNSLHRLQAIPSGATEDQEAEMKALRDEHRRMEDADDEPFAAMGGTERYGKLEEEIEKLDTYITDQTTYRDSDKQFAGCIVTLGSDGTVIIHKGLVRPEDLPKPEAPKATTAATPAEETTGSQPDAGEWTDDEDDQRSAEELDPNGAVMPAPVLPGAPADLEPAAPVIVAPVVTNYEHKKPENKEATARKEAGMGVSLAEDLRAVRTEVIKSHLAQNPEAAFNLLLYHLTSSVLGLRRHEPALNIEANDQSSYPFRNDQHTEIEKVLGKTAKWKKAVKPPAKFANAESRENSFDAICQMPQPKKMQLLAGIVAMTLNPQLAFEPNALDDVEKTVGRLDIDFAKLARPSGKLYWARITRERMLEIAAATLGDHWVKEHRNAKKTELTDLMDQAFKTAGKGPADVDAEARKLALQWTMPGFTAFDKSETASGPLSSTHATKAETGHRTPTNGTKPGAEGSTKSDDADAPPASAEHTPQDRTGSDLPRFMD